MHPSLPVEESPPRYQLPVPARASRRTSTVPVPLAASGALPQWKKDGLAWALAVFMLSVWVAVFTLTSGGRHSDLHVTTEEPTEPAATVANPYRP